MQITHRQVGRPGHQYLETPPRVPPFWRAALGPVAPQLAAFLTVLTSEGIPASLDQMMQNSSGEAGSLGAAHAYRFAPCQMPPEIRNGTAE